MKKTDWIDVIAVEQSSTEKEKSQAFYCNGGVCVYSAGWSSGII